MPIERDIALDRPHRLAVRQCRPELDEVGEGSRVHVLRRPGSEPIDHPLPEVRIACTLSTGNRDERRLGSVLRDMGRLG